MTSFRVSALFCFLLFPKRRTETRERVVMHSRYIGHLTTDFRNMGYKCNMDVLYIVSVLNYLVYATKPLIIQASLKTELNSCNRENAECLKSFFHPILPERHTAFHRQPLGLVVSWCVQEIHEINVGPTICNTRPQIVVVKTSSVDNL